MRDLPLGIVECNREQLGVLAQELRAAPGIRPRSILLEDLELRGLECWS